MILIDANVLVYAVNTASEQYLTSRKWVEDLFNGPNTVGLALIVLLAFLRITTSRRILEHPLSMDEAIEIVDGWLQHHHSVLVEPTNRHTTHLFGLLRETGSAANLVNDAHLAALAFEHNASIASFDTDFGRFTGLKLIRPGVR